MCEVPIGQTGKSGFQTASPELPRLQTGKLYDARTYWTGRQNPIV
jgi:hypothetical protein